MRRALQLLRRTAPVATATAVAACDDDKFTVEKVNVIKIPHLRDQGFPGANKSNVAAFGYAKFVSDEDCVLGDIVLNGPSHTTKAYTRAGPREKLHFDPQDTRCAIVTCGGLCPGLNTVVKNLVEILESRYGVEKIYGIKGGYRGFTSVGWDAPLELTADCVKDIHREGGTLLGTSRGGFDAEKIVECGNGVLLPSMASTARHHVVPRAGGSGRSVSINCTSSGATGRIEAPTNWRSSAGRRAWTFPSRVFPKQ